MLIVVFGAGILLSVLIFIILKKIKYRGVEAEDNEFSEKILKWRHDEMEYSYVVYSSVSQ
ncbi:hypothetical protein PGIGA_G00145400 [Pangasianodon gigas]|uniref:Uncharacterized protein n=1 Tax=Pangasianodon gigas TaxID=30993 RepID=A0ACC5XME8_PANGG|nr:hypothetical protein [Pangasianodon gigas]